MPCYEHEVGACQWDKRRRSKKIKYSEQDAWCEELARSVGGRMQNLCLCLWKNVGGAFECVVPVMARVGMTGWSSGSVFDLNGARARTGTRARNHKNDRESKGPQAGLRNLFNMSMLSEQGSQL
jgi:hypothetical protein